MKRFLTLLFVASLCVMLHSCTWSDDRAITYSFASSDLKARGEEGAVQLAEFRQDVDNAIIRIGNTTYGDRLKVVREIDEIIDRYDNKGIKGHVILYGKMDTYADKRVMQSWDMVYGE